MLAKFRSYFKAPPQWSPKPQKTKYEYRFTIEFPTSEPIYATTTSDTKARLIVKALGFLSTNKPLVTYDRKELSVTDEDGWILQ